VKRTSLLLLLPSPGPPGPSERLLCFVIGLGEPCALPAPIYQLARRHSPRRLFKRAGRERRARPCGGERRFGRREPERFSQRTNCFSVGAVFFPKLNIMMAVWRTDGAAKQIIPASSGRSSTGSARSSGDPSRDSRVVAVAG